MTAINNHLEIVPCICGFSEAELIFTGSDRLYGIAGEFNVVRCVQCGLYRTNPRPNQEALSLYYPKEYGVYAPTAGAAKRMKIYADDVALTVTKAYPAKGKVLDIGCGSGFILQALKERGWDCVGLDFSAEAAEEASKRSGCQTFVVSVNDEIPIDDLFDVVIMSHVLEHLSQPAETLKRVWTLLKSGGLLYIALPNVDCWERKLFKANWHPWDLPRHLWHFSPKILTDLLKRLGYVPVSLSTLSGLYLVQSLRQLIKKSPCAMVSPEANQSNTEIKSNTLKELIKTFVFRLNLAFALMMGKLIKGEIMVCLTRKIVN